MTQQAPPIYDNRAIVDERADRGDAEQLEEFRTRDFSSLVTEFASIFEHTTVPVRAFPLVWRVSKELAPQYVRPPTRTWRGGTDVQRKAMDKLYRESGIDQSMATISERLVGQQAQVVAVEPARDGTVSLRSWGKADVWTWFDDPMQTDIREAATVMIRVPVRIKNQVANSLIEYGWRTYTQSEAWTDEEGTKVPVFGTDIAHGFGMIPLLVKRLEEPAAGQFWPPIATDMLAMQIGSASSMSDVMLVCLHQCFDREALVGPGAKQAMLKTGGDGKGDDDAAQGPNIIHAYDGGEEGLTHTMVSPNPKVEKHLAAIEKLIRWWGASSYVPIESLLNSTGITGDAKAEERHEQEQHRIRMETRMRELEFDLFKLIKQVANSEAAKPIVRIPDVIELEAVDYRYVEPRSNTLQSAQAAALRFATGLDSLTEMIARSEGITMEQAKERGIERLKAARDVIAGSGPAGPPQGDPPPAGPPDGGRPTPGIDRIAGAMGQ